MAVANALGANVSNSEGHLTLGVLDSLGITGDLTHRSLGVSRLTELDFALPSTGKLRLSESGSEVQNVFLALAIPWAIQCAINRQD